MAMGSIWESEFGISSAVNFGLIYASMGFVISFVIGVPAARYAIRHGLNQNTAARLTEEFLSGVHDESSRPETGRQVTHSANVDSLVFHLSILGVAYLATNEYLILMQSLLDGATLLGVPMVLVFSHNLFFVHGLMVCLILRGSSTGLGMGTALIMKPRKELPARPLT